MKYRICIALLLVLMKGSVQLAQAQSASVYFGLGTAVDSSNGQPVDTFGNGTVFNTPKMAGLFETLGGDVMFRPHLGVGFETAFRSQSNYAGLNYRPLFYDFNAIYEPVSNAGMIVPEFQAGLGGANLRFYENQSYCDSFGGCSSSDYYVESSNHFQLHFSAGARFYVKGGIFIRPQVDAHWVNNFFQFGSNWVPEYSAAIGYTFGRNR
ncbi:MAG: hypothetical protein ABSA57_11500 [Candidatus Acidiferrales bacterium]